MQLRPKNDTAKRHVETSSPLTTSKFAMVGVVVHGDIAELPIDVRSFLSEQCRHDLCLSESWFELLLRYSPPAGLEPRIYVVRSDGGRTVDCVMFAMSAKSAQRPRKLMSLTNFYTMTYAPIVRDGLSDIQVPLDALARHIVGERPGWDIIELSNFIHEQPLTLMVVQAFQRAGFWVGTYAQHENWFLPVQGQSAEEYFASRPSQVRNTILRKLKKVRKDHNIELRFYPSADNLARGLDDYTKVYAQSWKGAETYPDFIPQLLRSSAARGILRLGVLHLDGAPAAAQIWLVTGRRATIYKLAYDDRYAPLSVGSILTKLMFDRIISDDAVMEIDYGVGSEPYKRDWMSDCRHVVGLICFNRLTIGGLLGAASHYGGYLRRLFSRSPRRAQITAPGAGRRARSGEETPGGAF
jgi:hypothetical protein